jgi:NAD(P)-dependent dehydrogenase (short-subunit alcohol dehydrogenase family)
MPAQPTAKAAMRRPPLWYLGRPAATYVDALAKRAAPRPVSMRHDSARSQRPAALVIGGGRGIGRLLAERLAGAGYAVGLIARSADELAEARRLVEAAGGRAAAVAADVTDAEAAPDVLRHLEAELGPTELLVNNAGILGPMGPAWEVDLQPWWRTVEVNLFGAVVYTRLALASMAERGRGRIINITSQAGAFRWPIVSAYSVSKAATIKLTENLAVEARRHGVSMFSIHPGLLPIGLTEGAFGDAVHPGSYEAGVYAWAQRELAEGRGADPDRAIDQILRVASGRYDALSGRHLSVHDDLDGVLAGVDDGGGRDLYVLSEIMPRQRPSVLAVR